MILEISLGLISILLILKGSEWVTDSVSIVAQKLNTTTVAIGLLLVSTLLSLPELLVAILAIFNGHPNLSLGVSLGSVIINLGLVVGLASVIRPIKVSSRIVTREGIFMLVATIIVATIALTDGEITQKDGFILLLLFIPYIVNVYVQEKALAKKDIQKEIKTITKSLEIIGKLGLGNLKIRSGILILLIGSIMLLLGSELFVRTLIYFTEFFNLPELLVGLTIGALGPSIPNIAAAIQAVNRKYDELVISETIGSNIFTLLITIGVIAMIQPIQIDFHTALITTPALIFVTLVFFYYLFKGKFSKTSGIVLLISYFAILLLEFLIRS